MNRCGVRTSPLQPSRIIRGAQGVLAGRTGGHLGQSRLAPTVSCAPTVPATTVRAPQRGCPARLSPPRTGQEEPRAGTLLTPPVPEPGTVARVVAQSVAATPGVLQLQPTVLTRVLAMMCAWTEAVHRIRHRRPGGIGACTGVCVHVRGAQVQVAVDLSLDPATVPTDQKLQAAVAITAAVECCVQETLTGLGCSSAGVDITVHALHQSTRRQRNLRSNRK